MTMPTPMHAPHTTPSCMVQVVGEVVKALDLAQQVVNMEDGSALRHILLEALRSEEQRGVSEEQRGVLEEMPLLPLYVWGVLLCGWGCMYVLCVLGGLFVSEGWMRTWGCIHTYHPPTHTHPHPVMCLWRKCMGVLLRLVPRRSAEQSVLQMISPPCCADTALCMQT